MTERQNYLWLAHSKLRHCSFGPELLVAEVPRAVQGTSRVLRRGKPIWEKTFLTGEENMCHTIANLEHHHFKYMQFRRPGDLHVHFFGTATLSFADGVRTQEGRRIRDRSAGVWTATAQFVALNSGGRSRCCCVALDRESPGSKSMADALSFSNVFARGRCERSVFARLFSSLCLGRCL